MRFIQFRSPTMSAQGAASVVGFQCWCWSLYARVHWSNDGGGG